MTSLYLHIPFCEVKCGYCDFFSVPRGFEDFDLQEQYVKVLIQEIHARSECFSKLQVQSIFFGGGTPSLLEPKLLEQIFSALARHFSWTPETEITLETNPKTVSLEKLKTFRSLGVNRLSVGVQSFQDRFLKILGRVHDGHDAVRVIHDAREAGFENVSCDLIFALPGQTFEDWKRDLNQAISLETDHLSAYHLTIEKGTPFEGLQREGRLLLPDEEEGIRMLSWTRERLTDARMAAYEISNFARPGFESVHNKNYWHYGDYLGFGAGAVSFIKGAPCGDEGRYPHHKTFGVASDGPLAPALATGQARSLASPFGVRRHNVRNLKKYLEGERLDFEDRIDRPTAMGEFCMLALRTRDGISGEKFQQLFKERFENLFKGEIGTLSAKRWLETIGRDHRLTPEGFLWTDTAAALFLPG